ncbi:MAG: imidazolonepropionase [Betaproteobacteria bacterium]
MDCVITDVRLATMEPGGEPFGAGRGNAIAFHQGRIAWIGDRRDAPHADRHVDGEGRWMTPGLIDCHTHLVHAGHRANELQMRLAGATYEEIARSGGGIHATVRATRAASEDRLVALALPRLKALVAEGVTVVEVKSGYGLDAANEVKMLRAARALATVAPVTVRTTLLALHALPKEFEGRADDYVDYVCRETLPTVAAAGLADAVDAFCERIAFTPAQVERVLRAARERGLPVKLHAEQLSNQGGAELAARYQALSADHLEYVDELGVAALARAGTVAVLLPGAFFHLREKQLPPVELLRKHHVAMAVATDHNPGTSPYASLLLMLDMACTQFRLWPEEALAGATRNAARALGMQATQGTLAVGKAADALLWNIEDPAQLACGFGAHRPAAVFRAGREVAP